MGLIGDRKDGATCVGSRRKEAKELRSRGAKIDEGGVGLGGNIEDEHEQENDDDASGNLCLVSLIWG